MPGRWPQHPALLGGEWVHRFDGAQGTDLAGQIFANHFEPGSLIEEERLSPEVFGDDLVGARLCR
jgi:hypothetical protein